MVKFNIQITKYSSKSVLIGFKKSADVVVHQFCIGILFFYIIFIF